MKKIFEQAALTDEQDKAGCNHWPGQKRCGVCGMGSALTDEVGNLRSQLARARTALQEIAGLYGSAHGFRARRIADAALTDDVGES